MEIISKISLTVLSKIRQNFISVFETFNKWTKPLNFNNLNNNTGRWDSFIKFNLSHTFLLNEYDPIFKLCAKIVIKNFIDITHPSGNHGMVSYIVSICLTSLFGSSTTVPVEVLRNCIPFFYNQFHNFVSKNVSKLSFTGDKILSVCNILIFQSP